MSYVVTKRPAQPITEPADKTAIEYVAHWINTPDEFQSKVKVYTDGCCVVSFTRGNGFMYSDEARGLRDALDAYLADLDKKHKKEPTQAELNKFIGPKLRGTLTHNRDVTRSFLETAMWRRRKKGGVEIKYNNRWLHLCRTDLVDDVRTWTDWSSHGDPGSLSFYKDTVAYGSRVTEDAFFIVDAYSDG